MFQSIGENGGAKPLHDDISAVILESFGYTGYHRHADQQAKILHQSPYKVTLTTDTVGFKNFSGFIMPVLFWVHPKFIQHLAEQIRVQHRKGLVNGRQKQRQGHHPFIGGKVF
jgi:hypothetical protein